MSFQAADLVVEPDKESSGHCDCCGKVTRRIWGYIATRDACVALYYVRWTLDHLEHDPLFELVIGPGAKALLRKIVSASHCSTDLACGRSW